MKVWLSRPREVYLLVTLWLGSLVTTGCLVEKERNPGAKAAQRAAERRREASDQTSADVQVIKTSATLRAAQGSTTTLAVTRPKSPHEAADQIVATLEPMLPKDYDCSRPVGRRILDHYNGETEISGPSLDIISGIKTAGAQLTVIYKEVFDLHAGLATMEDLLPGEYRLQIDVANGDTSRIYERSVTYISIVDGTKSEATVNYLPISDTSLDSQDASKNPDSALRPYSEVCRYGRTKATTRVFLPQYVDAVSVSEG